MKIPLPSEKDLKLFLYSRGMLQSLFRGILRPSTALLEHLDKLKIPIKAHKPLRQSWQLRQLLKEPHDIVINSCPYKMAPIQHLLFLTIDQKPITVLVGKLGSNEQTFQKLDLGPGIHPSIFGGTILEVRYAKGTFHVCDVLFLKGKATQDRRKAIEELNEEVIPFLTRPKVYSYSDIPSICDLRLLFLSKDRAWSFVPETCGSKGNKTSF